MENGITSTLQVVCEMKTGWVELSGKWYFLKDSGKMAVSEKTADGYQVDATGAWVR